MDVQYVDDDGYTWLKRVKPNTRPEYYYRGITLGPPDLSRIPITEEDRKKLQAGLVDAQLVSAEVIRGSVRKLHETVKNTLPHQDTKMIVRYIKSIYQEELTNGR